MPPPPPPPQPQPPPGPWIIKQEFKHFYILLQELQTQYHDFIKRKMGGWRDFNSIPDDLNSTFYRTNDQLIELLQDRISKCEVHLRDLGTPLNEKELGKNLELGF